MDFVYTALEELENDISEQIRYNALSHRISQAEQADFDKFMKDDSEAKPEVVVDHLAQMQKSKRIDNG